MPPDVLLLGFDTSAAHCAAALSLNGRVLASAREEMARGQSERLVPMLEEVLAAGGAGWRDLGGLGVGLGPGNFTGTRIAVATARGLSLALGIEAVGVSAFEVLAHGATSGPLLTSVDARQDQVHLQPFAAGRPSGAPVTAPLGDIPADLALPGLAVIGFAADRIAAALGATAPRHAPAPVAHAIATIAAGRLGTGLPRPAPLYIRKPDAAPQRDAPPEIIA
jgi:tRNA threonylcarbamoyl adenosine modification protein YeaZ